MAVYDFEGIPLHIAAQGEIEGSIYTFGTYGLTEPPVECIFTIPGKPIWAKVYTGIWGGTEKYSGSAEISVNSLKIYKYSLYGEKDQNENVFCSGYGIYWISQDISDLLHSGENRIVVNTSRGENGNKLDGRIYSVFVVVAVDDGSGNITQYWLVEGNEDLHGEGWSGSNPTIHDSASYTFEGADLTGMQSAELTTILLASSRYQPDYISFNSQDLGVRFKGDEKYPSGSTDIGDERSFDANGEAGIESRYFDAENFDVSELIADGKNTVVFERGRDSDGDGRIDSSAAVSEGEDYIHPCLAILEITKNKGELTQDIGIEEVTAENVYDGTTGTLTAEVRNYGEYTGSPVKVGFYADGVKIGTGEADPGIFGIGEASVEWPGKAGEYQVSAKIESPEDSRSSNDEYQFSYLVEKRPDLSVKMSAPVRADDGKAAATEQSPSFLYICIIAIATAAIIYRKPHLKAFLPLAAVICLLICSPVMIQPASAADHGYGEYILPVEIINNGGSLSSAISLTVYIDDEKAAYTTFEGGIGSGDSQEIDIPIFTTPGRHVVRIIVDEEGSVDELEESNNSVEAAYDFP